MENLLTSQKFKDNFLPAMENFLFPTRSIGFGSIPKVQKFLQKKKQFLVSKEGKRFCRTVLCISVLSGAFIFFPLGFNNFKCLATEAFKDELLHNKKRTWKLFVSQYISKGNALFRTKRYYIISGVFLVGSLGLTYLYVERNKLLEDLLKSKESLKRINELLAKEKITLQLEEVLPFIANLVKSKTDSRECLGEVSAITKHALRGMKEVSRNVINAKKFYTGALHDLDAPPLLSIGPALATVHRSVITEVNFVLELAKMVIKCENL